MRKYVKPVMYAEVFVANQYIAACQEAFQTIPVMQVQCETQGHNNTAINNMFTDSNTACTAKYNPSVGDVGADGRFHTQFEACNYGPIECNRYNYQSLGGTMNQDGSHKHNGVKYDCNWIMHDTSIDLSTAQKYQLS